MDTNQKETVNSQQPCPIEISPGKNSSINETFNGATICTMADQSLQLELPDSSRTGGEWLISPPEGILMKDEGTIWYDENNVPTNIPGLGRGVHSWKILITKNGTHNIHAELRYPVRGASHPERTFDVTLRVP